MADEPKMDAFNIPIAPGRWIILWGKFPLTQEEWFQFMAVLNAMHPGLVRVEPGKGWNQ